MKKNYWALVAGLMVISFNAFASTQKHFNPCNEMIVKDFYKEVTKRKGVNIQHTMDNCAMIYMYMSRLLNAGLKIGEDKGSNAECCPVAYDKLDECQLQLQECQERQSASWTNYFQDKREN